MESLFHETEWHAWRVPHSFAVFANEWAHCHNLMVGGVTVKFKRLCLFLEHDTTARAAKYRYDGAGWPGFRADPNSEGYPPKKP